MFGVEGVQQFMFTPELLKSCTIELSEKYNIGYSYEDNGIYISVAKHEDGKAIIVLNDVIPWPCMDEFYVVQREL